MNIFSTLDQPYSLLATVYLGILLGVLYTFFGCIRSLFKNTATRLISDIIFALSSVVIALRIFYDITAFDFRFYHFLGFGIGFFVFTLAAKNLLRSFRDKVYNIHLEIKKKRKYNNITSTK